MVVRLAYSVFAVISGVSCGRGVCWSIISVEDWQSKCGSIDLSPERIDEGCFYVVVIFVKGGGATTWRGGSVELLVFEKADELCFRRSFEGLPLGYLCRGLPLGVRFGNFVHRVA